MRPLLFLAFLLPAAAAPPTPEAHFGHAMGADRELIRWSDTVAYFERLDAASDSLILSELGKSTEGRPFVMATIAAPDTLAELESFREIQHALADPRKTPPDEAQELIARGKPVVLITCSIHSTEVASTLTAVQFAYDLLAEETPRRRAILENTIFLLIPSLNPDGVDKVYDWYERWLGTEYEGAPMTELYHKYAGHDNNRDWYRFSQVETRLAVEHAHNAWRPQIVYDVHQMSPDGARIFVPPWIDPIDPNIDPLIVQQVNAFGAAMAVDLTAAGKKGVVIHGIYDYFTPARHYQSYHGAMRLLSESAGARYASPITVPFEDLQERARNYNARRASWNFLEPWPGGVWRLQDIVDNQLITFESVLYNAALRREDLLRNFYRIGQRVSERGAGQAYVIPREQHDRNAAAELLQILQFGLVEIDRAQRDAAISGRLVHEGDRVIRLDQPYGAFAKTLLARQEYPDLREYPGGPPKKPYDVTAHNLPLLMGVRAFPIGGDPVSGEMDIELAPLPRIEPGTGRVDAAENLELSPELGSSWIAVNRLLRAGAGVHRDKRNGSFYIPTNTSLRVQLGRLAQELDVDFVATGEQPEAHPQLEAPRIGLYSGHVPIMDEGWTRWLLERYEFAVASVDNARLQAGDLGADYDVLILPDAPAHTLHDGYRADADYRGSKAPPEFTGGIGVEGAVALRAFAEGGGTILAFNRASEYAIDKLDLKIDNTVGNLSNRRFYGPGALVNVKVDVTHPLCFGMRPRETVWFESGPAFRTLRRNRGTSREVLTYPPRRLLASGWLLGESYLANRAAVVEMLVGDGRIVLFGIRPQYRAQPNAAFKMVFNGLFY